MKAGAGEAQDRDRAADAAMACLPAFSLAATCGALSHSQLLGAPLVLYFYPKDATPGCTTQARGFRDLAPAFARAGIRVVGVSRDPVASHLRFRDREQLPFDLIADTDEVLCTKFDVIRDKNLYGRKVRGIVRSTFLFDARGRLVAAWRGVKASGHAQAVLDAMQAGRN